MTTSKHTPGPWRIGMSADHTPAVCVDVPLSEGSGFVVAHINRLPRMGSVAGCADANARLIVAAPELLEVAQSAPALSRYHTATGFDIEGFVRAYEDWSTGRYAAIAAATGEQA